MKRRLICLAIVAALAPAVHAGKLDAALLAVQQQPALAGRVLPQAALARSAFAAEPSVLALLRYQGRGLEAARSLGVKVRSVSGDVASVEIPLSKLRPLTALSEVIYIEAAREMRARLDASVPATRADTLRTGSAPNWGGVTGQGVVVGVIDDGVDFRHADFRKPDGTSRILALWDQRASGTAGSPPSGFDYGGECTQAMINQAISEGVSSMACRQPSSGNHGTHVAGIASGNGAASGNSQSNYRFVGMAPMADLIVANSIGGGVSTGNAVVDAVNYIKQKAKALGKPAVVNLSLGSYYGARDGTSNYERALSNAASAGFILVGAAGNESTDKIRAFGNITQGETVTVGYRLPHDKAQTVEIWYPGTNQYSIKIVGPQAECASETLDAGGGVVTKETPCGQLVMTSTDINPTNDDRQIRVNFNPGSSPLMPGQWSIQLTAKVAAAGSSFSMVGADDGNNGVFTDHTEAVTHQILTDTASATQVIAVAAYVTKTNWNSLNGPSSNTNHGALGDVAAFSSRGPRRNCSNLGKCPAIMKPEIAAPGAMIMASLAHDAKRDDKTVIEADDQHVAYNGTSMATPHVSGAIALLLQKNPNLTPDEVKRVLFSNVQTNQFTGTLPQYSHGVLMPANPNHAWGYGILDANRAYQAVNSGVTLAKIEGVATGTSDKLSLKAVFTPLSTDVGKPVRLYIAAMLPGGALFVLNNGRWEPFQLPLGVAKTETATERIEFPILSEFDARLLAGISVLAGYGVDDNDMLVNKKYDTIYTFR
ncbi:S8 family serine peptidase [Chitinimonas lacunae]|uniref:S8 family serine peptidase n=1 Tax=Chitinimonas lacunae TaxID=1963018 RepID=A0ABV8MT82_9NEIS